MDEEEILKKRLEELESKYKEGLFDDEEIEPKIKEPETIKPKKQKIIKKTEKISKKLKPVKKTGKLKLSELPELSDVELPKIEKFSIQDVEEPKIKSTEIKEIKIKDNRPNEAEIKKIAENIKKMKKEISKIIVGQEKIVDGLIMGLLCNAHVLVEGVPGIAKTLAIRALAAASGCNVKRVQFTVDMLPTDIIGIVNYTPEKGFEVIKGPIFANFIIADEINRAPPKCVLGDTPIFMENGEIADIKEIVKKYNGKKTFKQGNEYWIIPKKKLKLLAFDLKDYKIRPEEVKYLYKQKTSEPYYEVELKSGRKIKTSKIHPFFTLENGEIKTISANDLEKGDCVLIPRKLSVSGDNKLVYNKKFLEKSKKIEAEIKKRKKLYVGIRKLIGEGEDYKKIKEKLKINNKNNENLLRTFMMIKPKYFNYGAGYFYSDAKQFGQVRGIKKPKFITRDFARFMAILIAEGNVNKSYFYLTMKDKEIPELFIKLIKNLFGLNINLFYDKKRGQYRVAFRSDALVGLLRAVGYNPHLKAGEKSIPKFILKAKDEVIREFLKIYYECDGCVSRDCVKVTTKSKEIANSISYLLLRMGFVAKINKELCKASIRDYYYKRNFYNLRLYGGELNEFYNRINFFTEESRKKLQNLIKTVKRKQIDLIPGMHQVIKDFRKNNKINHKHFYDLTGMHANNLENPKNALMHSRYRLGRLSKSINSPQISKIAEGDFYCDFVKKNREIKPKKDYWLYDFSMRNKHSFVAGFGGIISHNTQSALIEGMQEKQVTIGRKKYLLPDPFFVMATENPIEQAGVYPLPEAQIDRFLFKLIMGYPESKEEKEIMETNITIKKFEEFNLKSVVTPKDIIRMQEIVKKVYLDESIKNYIISIVRKTRTKDFTNAEYISYGSSPRASIGLFIASKARALMLGRNYVLPEDVKYVVFDVMRHRLILSYKAIVQKIEPDDIIKEILNSISVE